MEQKTVVDTSLRELRRHGSDDFPNCMALA